MKTALKFALISASFMTFMTAAMPAMAEDSSVLCSVKQNYANVAAQYTPGVDVNGNPVAPADVNTPPRVVLPTVRIPVTVDMAQRLSAVLPPGTAMESLVSIAEVRGDGRVFINGQDMTAPATAVCSTIEKQKAAAMRTQDRPKAARKAAAPKAPEVAAKPVEPVAKEVIAAPADVADAPIEPAIETPVTETPVAPPAPQVLQPTEPASAPAPAPTPAAPAPEAAAPAPAPEVAPEPENLTEPAPAPQTAPQEEPAIVAPSESGQLPRPPMDPFAPADGTIQGGAQ